jgi:hypothetical protein
MNETELHPGTVLGLLKDFKIYDLVLGYDFIRFQTTSISIEGLDRLARNFGTNKIGVENLYEKDLVEVTVSGIFDETGEEIFFDACVSV